MSTTTISRPVETKSFTGTGSVMERIRERRRAAEAKRARQVDTSNLSVGFMSKSQRASNMPSYPGLDRWRLLEKIGDGAFSSVYRASDTKSEFSEVAIKVTKKYEMKEEQKKKLHDEVEITRKLDHDHVVRLLDASESIQYHYMFLELCPGGELYEQIVKFVSLSEQMGRHVIKQVASAVEYLHDTMGVVHRDIKPENILFYPSSTTPDEKSESTRAEDEEEEAVSIADFGANDIGVVKLADFGLSKVIQGAPAATPCGTMSYAAPELFRKHRYTTSVDMWALGCLLFTMLAGFPPFYHEDLDIMRRNILQGEYSFSSPKWDTISDSAKDLISRLLTVNPDERSTIKECLEHPWMQVDSGERTPTNDASTPNLEHHRASTGTTPIPQNFPVDNESGDSYPETPNIRDIYNVALSVHKEQHQSQQKLQSNDGAEPRKSADAHRLNQTKSVLSNLSLNNSKLLEKRRMRACGGPSIPSC